MKLLIVSTTVFPLPPTGYSGTEYLVYHLAEGLHARGHQVSVVAPTGSRFSEGIELIPTDVMEEEEKVWLRYRGRLEQNEWQAVLDATFQRWSMMSSAGHDPEFPIVNWHHTSPTIYGKMPPVRYPMWVGLSKAHAEDMSRYWGVSVKYVYNGIDTHFYRGDGRPRGARYAVVGRYTPEKGFLDMILMAKRLKIGLDLYGDTSIIGSPDYMNRCFREADGYFAKVNPGISREATVQVYSQAHGILHLHSWSEPFSLVISEAQACGCAPIAMRRGGPTELIRHGETGFLVDNLEEAEELIKKDAVKDIKPEAMRKWVENRFSLQHFVDRWEKLLLLVTEGGERW